MNTPYTIYRNPHASPIAPAAKIHTHRCQTIQSHWTDSDGSVSHYVETRHLTEAEKDLLLDAGHEMCGTCIGEREREAEAASLHGMAEILQSTIDNMPRQERYEYRIRVVRRGRSSRSFTTLLDVEPSEDRAST